MVAVELKFIAPDYDNIAALYVEEATSQAGPFTQIQTFSAGTAPDYISHVVVTAASSLTNWFRIRWQDSNGYYTPYSDPVQGGTTTIVSQIKDRVIIRDTSVDDLVARQEAEVAVAEYFNVDDPYSVLLSDAPPKIIAGLTLLTLARVYALRLIGQGSTHTWAAGLVSMSVTSNDQAWRQIEHIIALANRDLNRNYSTMLLLKEISVAGGQKQLKSFDVSRSLIEIA